MRHGSFQNMVIIMHSITLGLINTWYSVGKSADVELTACACTLKRSVRLRLLVKMHYSPLLLKIKVFLSHPVQSLTTDLLSMEEIKMPLPANQEKREVLKEQVIITRIRQVLLAYTGVQEQTIIGIFILKKSLTVRPLQAPAVRL